MTDEIGHEADSAVLALSVTRPLAVEVPRLGSEISFAVSRDGGAERRLGDPLLTTSVAGDTRSGQLTVTAAAIGPDSALVEQRDASWTGMTIRQIVDAIAGRAGLVPVVSAAIADVIPAPSIQSAESDRQYLGRLMRAYDARVLVKDGRLIVRPTGETGSLSGAMLPALAVDLRDGSWVRWRRTDPGVRGSVSARYYGPDGSTVDVVTVGSGSPRRRLSTVYPGIGPARLSAQRMLGTGRASRDWIEIERQLTLDARALYPLSLTGAPQGFSGALTIQSVRHSVSRQVARTTIRARP